MKTYTRETRREYDDDDDGGDRMDIGSI